MTKGKKRSLAGLKTCDFTDSRARRFSDCTLLPPQGFGPEAKTRGGIIVSPSYACKECVKYWCSMRINPDLKKLGAHGGPG